jgi:hypothetical protein
MTARRIEFWRPSESFGLVRRERGRERDMGTTHDDGRVPALDLGVLIVISATDGYLASL